MEIETKAFGADADIAMQQMLRTFDAFKEANDSRLDALERRRADVVLDDKVRRIDDALSEQKGLLDRLIAAARPPVAPAAAVSTEAKSVFDAYIRSGAMSAPSLKAISATDADGSVIAPDETARLIDQRLASISPIRQIATVRRISGNTYRKPFPIAGFGSGWVAEAAARPQTTTPGIVALDFQTAELYAMPAATQVLLDDAAVDVSQWIADEVQTDFAAQESQAFVAGNGTNRPRGFLSYTRANDATRTAEQLGTVSSAGAAVAGDDLINLVYTAPQDYRINGRFVLNRKTMSAIRRLKDGENNYLWSPGLAGGQASTLLGYPVTESEHMPDVGNAAVPVAFGDFARGYLIVDRAGIRVLRDPYTAKPYVLFYTTKRVGGGIQDYAAIKFLVMSA